MLDKQSIKLLKAIKKAKLLPESEAKQMNGAYLVSDLSHLNFLSRSGFIVRLITESGNYYSLTLEGYAYLEQRTKDAWLLWLPWAVTTLLAITSVLLQVLD